MNLLRQLADNKDNPEDFNDWMDTVIAAANVIDSMTEPCVTCGGGDDLGECPHCVNGRQPSEWFLSSLPQWLEDDEYALCVLRLMDGGGPSE
ncbi:MAG: hypothetical protein ABIJ75_06215 [Actinomycetota bacterium]